MIGKRIVILGSGDIGLIMARRLTLEGAEVLAVIEIMREAGGLTRNVSQCLYDFNIPLYLGHTVSRIIGEKWLNAVEISKVGPDNCIIPGTAWKIECDTLVLSVGLIPENELAKDMGVRLDEKTNGVITDKNLQTNIPGVFSCGNSRKVMDLADFVSAQGETAGKNAARYIREECMEIWNEDSDRRFQKGVPDPGMIICTLCPNGCQIQVKESGEFIGGRCGRGEKFAEQEYKSPERILTTTIRITGASVPVIAVRSESPVKRNEMRLLLNMLHKYSVQAPVAFNQVLFENIGENRVNIISEQQVEKFKGF